MSFHLSDMDQITPTIYLGNLASSTNVAKLKELGIKKVLSVMDIGAPNYGEEKNFNHKVVRVCDIPSENIIQYFGDCLNFIKGEEKVLVHCMAGASRSASIVIAYIMWNEKKKLHEVYNIVKEKRFIIFPNPGFKYQLQLFEKELIKYDYDIDKINFKEIKVEQKSYGSFWS